MGSPANNIYILSSKHCSKTGLIEKYHSLIKTVVQRKQFILLSVCYLFIAAHKRHYGTEKPVAIAAGRRGNFTV